MATTLTREHHVYFYAKYTIFSHNFISVLSKNTRLIQYNVLRICNISAAGLNDNFTVTVTSGQERGTVTYSPMTYCYKAQTSDNAKLVNTVRALYLYWEATDEYFD